MKTLHENSIAVKIGRRIGYAVYSEQESRHSTNASNKTYRIYTKDGTYVMHAAGWQIDKMLVKECVCGAGFDATVLCPFHSPTLGDLANE